MKFIISFTTTPCRINKIKPMLDSILNQQLKPNLIILNLPEIFYRTGEKYIIPNFLNENITINRVKKDYGPATKIIPTVYYLINNNYDINDTYIIYLDDDIKYSEYLVFTYDYLLKSNVNPLILCCSGFNFVSSNGKLNLYWKKEHNDIVSVAEGYASVCVPLNVFKNNFDKYFQKYIFNDNYKDCLLSDDVILSNYYHLNGFEIRIVNIINKCSRQDLWKNNCILEYGNLEDALHFGAGGESLTNKERYPKVLEILKINNELFIEINLSDNKLIEKYNITDSYPSISVSILIVSFNSEKQHIINCLHSINNQTANFNIEIVWINNGSDNDYTKYLENLLSEFIEKSRFIEIKYYKNKKKMNLGYSLNMGLKYCSNEIIFRMDSEDIMVSNRLILQYIFMVDNENIEMCGTQVYLFENFNEYIEITELENLITLGSYINNPSEYFINHKTVCFKKSKIIEIGNYNQEINEYADMELSLRILEKFKKIYNMDDALIYSRKNEKELSYISEKNNTQQNISNTMKYFINNLINKYSELIINYNNYIDIPVYCINLDSSVIRKTRMLDQFNKYNIDYKFVDAIDGNNIDNFKEGYIQGIYYKNKGIFTESYINGTNGSQNKLLACYLSHIKAIKEAYDDNLDFAIIMEDDISFKYISKWRYKISEILKIAPLNWTVLKLHTSNLIGLNILKTSFTQWVKWSRNFMSAGFYILNRKGMENVMNNIIKNNIYYLHGTNCLAADILIYLTDNENTTYVYNDFLVINNNNIQKSDSTISDSDWRKNLENQGILETKKFFKNNYIYLYYKSIPKILKIKRNIYNHILNIYLYVEEKIDCQINKQLFLKENNMKIIEINIIKKTDYLIICYINFKKKIKDNTEILFDLIK